MLRLGTTLVLGLVSSAALIAAALQLGGAPRVAGELALSETAGRLAAEVEREWARLARRPDVLFEGRVDRLVWRPDAPPPADAAPARAAEGDAYAVFDALFADAGRAELQRGDPASALATVLDALSRSADGVRRARARLRAIQLAVRLGRDDVAREQWRALASEASGAERADGAPALLLGALAAAPSLAADERERAREQLIEAWCAGRLALPEGTARTLASTGGAPRAVADPPALLAFARALSRLGGDPGAGGLDARLRADLDRRRVQALERELGSLPEAPAGGELGLRVDGDDVLAFRARESGEVEAVWTRRATLGAALERRVEALPYFPSGFTLEFGGGDEPAKIVRPPDELRPGFDYALRHEDPEAFIAAEGRRLGLLRAALFGIGVFALFAGVLSYRSLVRERRLAELKARFVANVSHELRTPVTAILLGTERLTRGRGTPPERVERYGELIHGEALRLRRLIDDVLDFSRLERGEGPKLEPSTVELAPFADELVRASRERVERAGLAFDAHTELAVARASLDADAVRRATLNLVENAVVHSGADRVELTVRADDELTLAVTDTGRGVPAAARGSVFDAFHQLDGRDARLDGRGERSPKARGAGLGLAIVREIARGHGGRVSCLAGPDDRGARFELVLPLSATPPARAPEEPPEEPSEEPSGEPSGELSDDPSGDDSGEALREAP